MFSGTDKCIEDTLLPGTKLLLLCMFRIAFPGRIMNTLYVENNTEFLKKKKLDCLISSGTMRINLDSAIKIDSLYEGLRDFCLTSEHNSMD